MITTVGGIMDTRTNEEDFAITPFLFGVYTSVQNVRIIGIGLSWGWWSVYIGLAKNLPKGFKRFRIVKIKQL